MNLLLDTHTLLWHSAGDSQMSATATALLKDSSNDLFLSMASAWELAIKVGLKKLAINGTYEVFLSTAIAGYGINLLPIAYDDCIAYERLPFPDPSHRNPFDRMIIAQAIRHKLSVVGVDASFDSYPIVRLW